MMTTGKRVLTVLAAAILLSSVETETPILSEDITPKRGIHAPVREETVPTAASVTSWYCKHTTGGTRPPIPPEMAYLTAHDGYFLGKDEKVIYLTFDAGYENGNIATILDVLREEEVPAAFFILENLVTKNTDLIKRMVSEGHTVCNHTARHPDMTKMPDQSAFSAELSKMERLYEEAIGAPIARYYRPPEGKMTEENLIWAQACGYKTILWSYAYADWDNDKQPDPAAAKEKLLAGTHNGEVLLLHPTSATNAAILGDLIQTWKGMGYRFGTLDELTGGGNV